MDSEPDTENGDDGGEDGKDNQEYVDRSKIDFDPDDGLYTGTAVEGTSDIPGSTSEDHDDPDSPVADSDGESEDDDGPDDDGPDDDGLDEDEPEKDDPAPA
jgi:hypothetical protein